MYLSRFAATALLASSLFLSACSSTVSPTSVRADQAVVVDGSRATLAILESTDMHTNVLSYDYYKLAEDPSLGFERLATLVREARQEYANTLLFDAGDTIQGNALADWQAQVAPLACSQKLAMYKAMDALGYDGGTIGNHEFNYGLPFLAQATNTPMHVDGVTPGRCEGPDFPLVLSNVFSVRDGKPLFAPYAVLERTLDYTDAAGRRQSAPIRIGILGFAPPPIMQWDKRHLDGRVTTKGVVEAAREYLPVLRAKDVDLVIAISHGGIDTSPYSSTMENANWYLSQESGIDVLLLGHSHQSFPAPNDDKSRFNNMPEVDNQRGFIHGKPAVMGNFWGKSLGVIQLGLVREQGKWAIDPAATHSEVRNIQRTDGSYVAADPAIAAAIRHEHEATIEYVSTPIGYSDFDMTSYFADVGDVTALQPVNMAQRDYVENYIQDNVPALRSVPVLSAAAPFKGGFGGATDYTDIPAGPLAIRNAADLYLFPNTLAALKINGSELKGWLERAAGRFNQIDPQQREPQQLINPKFPGYNFDVIQGGVSYLIDITKPYGDRIVDLRFQDRAIEPEQEFILVTNNYRASGGGHFPGADEDHSVLAAPDANREVLINWVRTTKQLARSSVGADRSWHFAPASVAGPVVFISASGKLGVAEQAGIHNVHFLKDNGDGTSIYALDLAKSP